MQQTGTGLAANSGCVSLPFHPYLSSWLLFLTTAPPRLALHSAQVIRELVKINTLQKENIAATPAPLLPRRTPLPFVRGPRELGIWNVQYRQELFRPSHPQAVTSLWLCQCPCGWFSTGTGGFGVDHYLTKEREKNGNQTLVHAWQPRRNLTIRSQALLEGRFSNPEGLESKRGLFY